MIFDLYREVALAYDLPTEGLRRGDVALDVFNAVGETVKVIVVPASALAPLTADQVWSVRPLTTASR